MRTQDEINRDYSEKCTQLGDKEMRYIFLGKNIQELEQKKDALLDEIIQLKKDLADVVQEKPAPTLNPITLQETKEVSEGAGMAP